jgi:predicted ATPase
VGPNGSGKSSLMRGLAKNCKFDTNLIVISNTPYDRFKGFKGANRLTAGRISQTPSHIIKSEIADSLLNSGAEFYQISSVLKLCGYEPRFGFELVPDARYFRERGSTYDTLDASNLMSSLDQPKLGPRGRTDYLDVENAVGFIARHDPKEVVWIDAEASTFEFSRSSEFAHVLKIEALLKKAQIVHKIRVLLTRRDDGKVVELDQASSGQIAMISTLFFMITRGKKNALVMIDEPENSLHPSWQRSYVERILAAMQYRGCSFLIATHSPLVVTGAIGSDPETVTVFSVQEGVAEKLALTASDGSAKSVEDILWNAFEVITPANHFVSERLVEEISRFEKGEVSKEDVLKLIESMEAQSSDKLQHEFFDSVEKLVLNVDATGR